MKMSRKIVKEYLKYHFNREELADIADAMAPNDTDTDTDTDTDADTDTDEDGDPTPEEIERGVTEHSARLEQP